MRKTGRTRPSSEPGAPGADRMAAYLAARRREVDLRLPALMPKEADWPPPLVRAMAYSLMAGGKRLRPILAMAAAEACGGSRRRALTAACAIELIHTYSLIHDDLPAMDDDDFRRGRPTSHRVHGEAMAILAGDALLTRAFEILAGDAGLPADTRLAVIAEISRAAGGGGMVGGQVADIRAEGRRVGLGTVRYIHRHKTGALITAAVRTGALVAGAGRKELAGLTAYGRDMGAAFQIVDDLLDEEGELAAMGKTPGSDRRRGKATYPAVTGAEAARRAAARLGRAALAAIRAMDAKADPLRGLVDRVLTREG